MADTERTLAALQAMFADNTAGNISPQDIRDMLVSVLGGYGEISDAGSTSISGTIGTSPSKLEVFDTDGPADGSNVTPNQANDRIDVAVAGVYEVHCTMESSSATDLEVFTFEVFDDGVATGIRHSIASSGGDLKESVQLHGLLDIGASSQIDVRVNTISAGRSLTVSSPRLWLKRVG
jgi:hypothetical protein